MQPCTRKKVVCISQRWRNTTSKSWDCARQGGYRQDIRKRAQERLSYTQDTRTAMYVPDAQRVAVMMSEKHLSHLTVGQELGSARANVRQAQNISQRDNPHGVHVLHSHTWCRWGRDRWVLLYVQGLSLGKNIEKDIVVMMGEFNAKVGNDNTGYTSTMGRHGVGGMNGNGQLGYKRDAIRHKNIHKTTWYHVISAFRTQSTAFA